MMPTFIAVLCVEMPTGNPDERKLEVPTKISVTHYRRLWPRIAQMEHEGPDRRREWAASTTETLRVLEGKWKIGILCQLFAARNRSAFLKLEQLIDVNQKMLIQRLRSSLRRMESCTGRFSSNLKVEYRLTEAGRARALLCELRSSNGRVTPRI